MCSSDLCIGVARHALCVQPTVLQGRAARTHEAILSSWPTSPCRRLGPHCFGTEAPDLNSQLRAATYRPCACASNRASRRSHSPATSRPAAVFHLPEPPSMPFSSLGFSPALLPAFLRAIGDKGYRVPTAIQSQTIPAILLGRDVVGSAQTGDRKSTRLNSSHIQKSRMPSSA